MAPTQSHAPSRATSRASTQPCVTPLSIGPSQPDPGNDTYSELRLLHNFSTGTINSLPGTHIPSLKDCWSIEVPKLAFSYQPLLCAIFAISALHVSKTDPVNSGSLGTREEYLERALREHRASVETLNTENADAACFTSILFLVDAFASLQDRPLYPYTPPIEWMQLARTSVSVFNMALEKIENRETAKIMPIIGSSPSFANRNAIFSENNWKRFSYLLAGSLNEDDVEFSDTIEAYKETITYIGFTQLAMENDEHPQMTCRRLMMFPILMPPKFIELVQALRPRALVILAYYFSLSIKLSDIWWIGHTAHREVHAIQSLLPHEWKSIISWPIEMVTTNCSICTQA